MKNDILILGLGNDILTDDGIGPRLVRDLSIKDKSSKITYDIACSGGLEIMENIKGYSRVIFIDAIRTRNGTPGDVYYFHPSDYKDTSHLSNLHDVYFLTALKLGEILQLDLPTDLHIIAIEIVEDMVFDDEFTPVISGKYPAILEKVSEIVEEICH